MHTIYLRQKSHYSYFYVGYFAQNIYKHKYSHYFLDNILKKASTYRITIHFLALSQRICSFNFKEKIQSKNTKYFSSDHKIKTYYQNLKYNFLKSANDE